MQSKKPYSNLLFTLLALFLTYSYQVCSQNSQLVTTEEFIYDTAPFPSCHASTMADTPEGLIAAWFGGTHENNPDVEIWTSRKINGKWTPPVAVANGIQHKNKRYPTWNPVLYQVPGGPLMLFYKVGIDVPRWWGMVTVSHDHGKTWSTPTRLPEDIYGPIKNKPVLLKNGTLICPSSTEDNGWRLQMELTTDFGKTWEVVKLKYRFNVIQASVLTHADGSLQVLCRTRESNLAESWSFDNGKTWTDLQLTSLPNPNSGTDAVTLKDGTHVLIYNHTKSGRSPLNVAVSKDGKTWKALHTLESNPGEYSYPAVIESNDGKTYFTYTWKRQKIKHAVMDLNKMDYSKLKTIENGVWPN